MGNHYTIILADDFLGRTSAFPSVEAELLWLNTSIKELGITLFHDFEEVPLLGVYAGEFRKCDPRYTPELRDILGKYDHCYVKDDSAGSAFKEINWETSQYITYPRSIASSRLALEISSKMPLDTKAARINHIQKAIEDTLLNYPYGVRL